ncbi:MAG: Rieske 2Fe-2S domain-containing protein [Pseudomonadota bacterium]
MSVKYVPVQWNRNKWIYDGVMLAGVGLFLWIFLSASPSILSHERAINPQVHNARAFGACAFLMLTVILCIGPLARLDERFLPLLYNRRHFGVMTVFVALTHASYILDWYFAFSMSDKYEALLFANTSFGQTAGFPFEVFGIFALIVLIILAATSHDFWMKFLTPPVWKRIHYLIYPAYIAVVAHVSLGILQDQQNQGFTVLFIAGAAAVGITHLLAALHERRKAAEIAGTPGQWVDICDASEMTEGFAKIKLLPNGERVAVFLMDGQLSAISNACAHQNGPLGEGRILDCLVTCPWHGFQYDVRTGRSPAPFTEMVPTYNLRLDGTRVRVDVNANAPGTPVDPVPLPAARATA